jgi:hypothetical protein
MRAVAPADHRGSACRVNRTFVGLVGVPRPGLGVWMSVVGCRRCGLCVQLFEAIRRGSSEVSRFAGSECYAVRALLSPVRVGPVAM